MPWLALLRLCRPLANLARRSIQTSRQSACLPYVCPARPTVPSLRSGRSALRGCQPPRAPASTHEGARAGAPPPHPLQVRQGQGAAWRCAVRGLLGFRTLPLARPRRRHRTLAPRAALAACSSGAPCALRSQGPGGIGGAWRRVVGEEGVGPPLTGSVHSSAPRPQGEADYCRSAVALQRQVINPREPRNAATHREPTAGRLRTGNLHLCLTKSVPRQTTSQSQKPRIKR